ncbi:putative glucan endo-1,3-beta-D-glucosidase [Helianthus anomalus]
MDISGRGQNSLLVPAQNVRYLEKQWCEFNPDAKDLSKLGENINYACTFADCTPLGYGSSCNGLDANANASYAFNAYFQAQNQNEAACMFQGLARITTDNISTPTCSFNIQIVGTYSSPASRASVYLFVYAIIVVVFLL